MEDKILVTITVEHDGHFDYVRTAPFVLDAAIRDRGVLSRTGGVVTARVTGVETDMAPGFLRTRFEALEAARGLIDGDATNTEYLRGVAELIADLFGYCGAVDMDRAKQRVCADLGLSPTALG